MRSAGPSASPTVPQAAEPAQVACPALRSAIWPAGLPWRLTGACSSAWPSVDRCLKSTFPTFDRILLFALLAARDRPP
jgi:hypothetical protein